MKEEKKLNHFGGWAQWPTLHPHRWLLLPPMPCGPPHCVLLCLHHCSCHPIEGCTMVLFSGVVGILWLPLHINNPQPSTSSVHACSQGLWAFSGQYCWLIIPQALKLSICAHFQRLWAFSGPALLPSPLTTPQNPWNQVFMLNFRRYYPSNPQERVFALIVGSLYPPPPPQQPSDPITPKIEHECSFSVVVVSLWLPTSTTPSKLSMNMVCFCVQWFPFLRHHLHWL